MFSIFKKTKPLQGTKLKLSINGMHCTSCSLDIDGTLEEASGILEATTSFAKSITTVTYNPTKISPEKIIKLISQTGYQAQISD